MAKLAAVLFFVELLRKKKISTLFCSNLLLSFSMLALYITEFVNQEKQNSVLAVYYWLCNNDVIINFCQGHMRSQSILIWYG